MVATPAATADVHKRECWDFLSTHFFCILKSLARVKFKLILAGAEQAQWLLNMLSPQGPYVKTSRLESLLASQFFNIKYHVFGLGVLTTHLLWGLSQGCYL